MPNVNPLLNQVRSFKDHYEKQPIFSRKGEIFNQRQTVELIDHYWNSEFLRGDLDDDGIYRFFYNIIKSPSRFSSYKTDFDTKDIRAIAEDGQSYVPVYFLNKELKAWMKDQNFGELLNELSSKLPKYGNVVLKVTNGDTKSVNIKNLVSDPYVPSLYDSYVVIEKHFMTPKQLKDQKNWDETLVDELVKKLSKQGSKSRIEISEIYTYKVKGKSISRYMMIVAGLEDYELDQKGNVLKDMSKILFEDKIDDLPYYEFFWEDYDGTWLREGVPLELMEDQMRVNEVVNLQGKGFHWTNKKIYQTKDMAVARNLFYGVRNGDVLRVNSEITPVAVEERNLASFREEVRIWEENVRKKVFSFEAATGETLPSGTPFRLGFLLQSAAGGYYDQKRENIGLVLKRLILEVIIPSFKKQNRKNHLFNLYGEDSEFEQLKNLYIEFELYRQLQDFINKTNFIPLEDEVNQERQRVLSRLQTKPSIEIDIPDNFYNDIKYKIDIVITNESVAMDAKIQTLTTVIQTIATNPTILQNETTRKILFRILDFAGINPEELRVQQQRQEGIPLDVLQRFSAPPAGTVRPELQLASKASTL